MVQIIQKHNEGKFPQSERVKSSMEGTRCTLKLSDMKQWPLIKMFKTCNKMGGERRRKEGWEENYQEWDFQISKKIPPTWERQEGGWKCWGQGSGKGQKGTRAQKLSFIKWTILHQINLPVIHRLTGNMQITMPASRGCGGEWKRKWV